MARGESWEDVEIVEIPVVVVECPTCESTRYEQVRGEACGDGTSFQRVKCSTCGERYKIFRQPVSARLGQSILDDL